MQTTSAEKNKTVAPALKALLSDVIDYAGIFPPAKLSLEKSCENFQQYENSEFNWMLHWLVLSADQVEKLPAKTISAVSIVGETPNGKAAALETKSIVKSSTPVYCEVVPGNIEQLDAIKQSDCFAKIRTGGVVPDAIPSPQQVAQFICDCADRKLAFKATAGLHHPIRANYPLTYETDAPHAVMHGFLNVLMAACFAWHGDRDIEPILSDTDAQNFSFDDRAIWKTKSLTTDQIVEARKNFIHSIGSCSFDEPVNELKDLNLLP